MALPVHERERSTEKYSEVGAARHRRRASSSLRPTPRRILTIDRNDGRWQVEARRGHGPHGRGRWRVRCPTGRTCGRWRVTIWSPCRLRGRRFTPTFTRIETLGRSTLYGVFLKLREIRPAAAGCLSTPTRLLFGCVFGVLLGFKMRFIIAYANNSHFFCPPPPRGVFTTRRRMPLAAEFAKSAPPRSWSGMWLLDHHS